MVRVAVVTDSASNLPAELVEREAIEVVPMILKFGDREVADGVDLEPREFYRALAEGVPMSTSAPSIGDFRAAFEHALGGAEGCVCVTVASFASVTHDAAVTAARDFGGRVRVVDSKSASLGEGFVALAAARAANEGGSLDEVAARAEEAVRSTSFIATINTFEFLRRSGRVNSVLAYAATTLDIKPVFAFRNGALHQLGRPRTRQRAIERVLVEVEQAGRPRVLGVAHADCAAEAEQLLATLRARYPEVEAHLSEFTPLMGAHTGPGVLGVGVTV
jgi:DegV family protein with EDD domain